MSLVVTVPNERAPVSLATALRHCRVLVADVDQLNLYLLAAAQAVEDYTALALLQTTYRLDLADWTEFCRLGGLVLPRSPLQTLDSVKYYSDGSLLTLDPANYRAQAGRLPPTVELTEDAVLPSVDARADAVQVTFTAGFGSAPSAIPPRLRIATLMLTQYWYDERSPVSLGNPANVLPMSVQNILRAERIEGPTYL
jgi:uncharacterized phiE125 gp8 family phage protein